MCKSAARGRMKSKQISYLEVQVHKGDLAVVGKNNRVEQYINDKFMMSVNYTLKTLIE